MKKYTGLSLFSGAGGMDVGFSNAGISVLVANEIVENAADTFAANFPEVNLLRGDVNEFKDEFSIYKGKIDVVFGGPPCQGFSVAGKMDPDDERSQLIWAFLEVVDRVQPKVFVMENVKALATLAKWSKVRQRYFSTVQEMGYYCHFLVLNAEDFGVSQRRERVFFIGSKEYYDPEDLKWTLEKHKEKPKTIRELFSLIPSFGEEGNPVTCSAKITLASNPVMRKSPYAGMLFNGMGRPLNLDAVSATLPASMGGNKTPIIDEELLEDPNADDWVRDYHAAIQEGKQTFFSRHLKGCAD